MVTAEVEVVATVRRPTKAEVEVEAVYTNVQSPLLLLLLLLLQLLLLRSVPAIAFRSCRVGWLSILSLLVQLSESAAKAELAGKVEAGVYATAEVAV